MPKATTASLSQKRRHNPLEDDLLATGLLKNREGRPSKRADRKQAEEQAYVDAKASRKILGMSRDLIDEEELQSGPRKNDPSGPSAFDFDPSRLEDGSDQEEEEEDLPMKRPGGMRRTLLKRLRSMRQTSRHSTSSLRPR
jgi:essential nuclear protein 1